MKTARLIAFLFLIGNAGSSFSQKLEFTRIPPPTGLHPGTVSGVQDLNGYMWIGTYQSALRRYDGYKYKLYTNDPQNPNSMGGNWMESLLADSKGFIWIGTLGQGLDRLDPSTGNFIHYRYDRNDQNSISNDTVRSILEDRNGMLWVGTQNGLNHFSPQTGEFKRYVHQFDDPYSLSCNRVMKVYEDRQGIIWIGTGSVWDGQGGETDEGGLNRFDKETERFYRYMHDPGNDHSLIDNKVKAIFEDSRGTFWVGTAGDGLHTMDRVHGTFQRHLHDPSNPKKLSRPPQKKIRPHADDHITFFIEDATGYVWIGTFGNGLNRVDPKTREVTHYPNFKDPESGLEMEVPWWACVTRDGMLWIGYWRGLYQVDPLPKNIPYFSTGSPVTQILTDRAGALWYGSDEGLVRKNLTTHKEQHFFHQEGNRRSLSNNRIAALFQDKGGSIWIGTGKGLNKFDSKSNSFELESFNSQGDSTLITHGIGAIHEDRQGSFWFGIISEGAGVVRKDFKSGKLVRYPHIPNDTSSFSIGEVYRIFEDKAGTIWIGTRGGGLNQFITEKGKFKHFLSGANIHNFWQDSDGILWIGTSTGLYKSNVELNSFARFTGPNDELLDNMVVNGVVEDDQQSLWVNASIGIFRINPERDEVLIFSRYSDPIFYNGTGSYKGKNGEILFGGGSGYFTVVPSQMKGNSKPPQIAFSDFRIADKPVLAGVDGSPLKAPLSSTTEMHLNHDQNVFSFDFAGIHYRSPKDNQHLFMMENLDNSWRKAGEEKTAYYYNVPPGEYVFKVKAANSDGMWSERSIAVIVDPPWWSTVWAYTFYAALFAASLYAGWRYLQKQEQRKNEQKVRQMKAEQILEMDKLKSRFFANISHEFRTPLTLILSPLDKLLADQSENSRRKALYEAMQRNARKLLYLVNELLDLSKLEARRMKLEMQPGDIIEFMRKVTASFASLAEAKKINFQVQSPAGTLWTYYDEDKLEKVLNNLLSNAFKFTPPSGEITISLRLSTPSLNRDSQSDNAYVQAQFCVRDNGSGIPAGKLDRIFDRFYQVDNSLTREQEGTGIGLALTRELVELHEGSISVSSEQGKWTQFTVLLPLEMINQKQVEAHSKVALNGDGISHGIHAEEVSGDAMTLPTATVDLDTDPASALVLIIEDNDDLRRFLGQCLAEETAFPCRVIEAANGQEGYELAIGQIPDLIISDVMMPKIDGVQLCHMLKNDKRTDHIPIILLTAKASDESKIEGLETGADDYLTKPFQEFELLARIKNLIEGRRKLRDRFSREITLQPASISMTSMDEKLLQHVMKIMEEHIGDSTFGVEAFGREAGMSRTQLHRTLKALTDQSPGDFIRIMRLKRAAELLTNQVASIAEVAFMVGFNDPSYFTKCFQKQFGRTPSEFILQN